MADTNQKIEQAAQLLSEVKESSKELGDFFDNLNKDIIDAAKKRIIANKEELTGLAEKIKIEKKFVEQLAKVEGVNLRTLNTERLKLDALAAVLKMKNQEIDLDEKLIQKKTNQRELFRDMVSLSGDAYKEGRNLTNSFKQLVKEGNFFNQLLVMAIHRFFELDNAAAQFRKETGLLISQTKEIDANIKALSRDFADFGLDVSETTKSAKALVEVFGDQFIASNRENVKFIGLMAVNLGIAQEDSAKMLYNFVGLGKTSSMAAKNMALGAISLAKSAGVPIGKVMKDMSSATGQTLVMLRGNTAELIKATVEARRLGTSIDKITKSGAMLLDFQTSIYDEMEASVLMGQNLNLQAARELAYRGDMKNLVKEQDRLLKSMGDVTTKDKFQQDAIAKALGMSTDEMYQRVSKQKELGELESKNPDLYKKYKAINDELEEGTKTLDERIKSELMEKQIQSEQTKLANAFKQIWVSVADILVPVVKFLMVTVNLISFLIKPLTIILGLFAEILQAIYEIGDLTDSWATTWDRISESFTSWWSNFTEDGTAAIASLITGSIILFALWKTNIISSIWTPFKWTWAKMSGLVKMGLGKMPSIFGKSGSPGSLDIESATKGATKINPKTLIAASVAMIAFAGAVFILAKAAQEFGTSAAQKGFENMAWASIILGGFTVAIILASSGITAASPVLATAALVMAAFGVTLLLFGKAAQLAGTGINLAGDGLKKLATINPLAIFSVAGSISILGASLISFGAAMASGGILSFLGGGMMVQLLGISALSPLLEKSATALDTITDSLAGFKDKNVVEGISAVTTAIKELNAAMEKTSTLKLSAMSAAGAAATSVIKTKETNDTTARKLDELIGLMRSGGIAVNIDGNRASYLLTKNTRERGGLGAIS